jgi:6-phosphogluconolactonase
VATDRTGHFLLTAYYGEGKAAVYPIDEAGRVLPAASSLMTTESHPHSILSSPNGRHVLVPNTGADCILQFVFDPNAGTLTPNAVPKVTTEPGSGPRHFYFHPSGKFVYFVNETNSSVTAFSYDDQTGQVEAIQNLSTLPDDFAGKNSCADVEIDPSGKFLYASNRGHDSIACFTIDGKTGRLAVVEREPTEKTPREFNVDPSGKYLYAAGQGSGRLASFRINAEDGSLERFATYDVGKSPSWVLAVDFQTR